MRLLSTLDKPLDRRLLLAYAYPQAQQCLRCIVKNQ